MKVCTVGVCGGSANHARRRLKLHCYETRSRNYKSPQRLAK